jgi:hypothetical protein
VATRRVFLRIVLAALLLVAQHAAVTHAIWHASDELAGHLHDHGAAHPGESHEDSTQAELCGFHLAFGQVLGTAHGNAATFAAPVLDAEHASVADSSCRHIATVPPQSRSPPSLS